MGPSKVLQLNYVSSCSLHLLTWENHAKYCSSVLFLSTGLFHALSRNFPETENVPITFVGNSKLAKCELLSSYPGNPEIERGQSEAIMDRRLNREYPPKEISKVSNIIFYFLFCVSLLCYCLGYVLIFSQFSQLAALIAPCFQYEAEFQPNMSIVVKALQPLLKPMAPKALETQFMIFHIFSFLLRFLAGPALYFLLGLRSISV